MPTDNAMHIGVVGLGRMGATIVRRPMRDGHRDAVLATAPSSRFASRGLDERKG